MIRFKFGWSAMAGLGLLILSGAVSTGSAQAAPINCTPSAPLTLTTVSATFSPTGFGGPSVTCGPMTFSGWQAVDFSGGSVTGLPLDLGSPSTYDPATGQTVLALNPNFMVANTVQDEHLIFTVTSTSAIIAVDLGVGGTNSSITERVCAGANSVNAANGLCTGTQLGVLTAGSGSTSVVSIAPSTTFTIFKDIGSRAGGELTSFSQSYTVPEPASLSLIGAGLVGLAFLRRRRT